MTKSIAMKKFGQLLVICFWLIACSNPDSTAEKQLSQDSAKKEFPTLNEGEKWQINSEMSPFISKGETLIQEFKPSNELSEYHQLAREIEAANQSLIKSCTMSGTSHDELHKWLHPHLELTKSLHSAQSLKEARLVYKEIRSSYSQFHIYFKTE